MILPHCFRAYFICLTRYTRTSSTLQMQSTHESRRSSSLIPALVLLTASVVAFCPVLFNPHWGLFSDSTQIVENCRIFWSSSDIRWDLVQGYLRPGFHALDLTTWVISPENPLGFYLVRLFFFAVTLQCTYLSCLSLSKSKLIALSVALYWFVIGPTYEVIYTLDKAEMHIGFALSIIVAAIYLGLDKYKTEPQKKPTILSIVIFLAALFALLTKETGQLCVMFTAMFAMFLVAANRIGARWKWLGSDALSSSLPYAVASAGACAAAFLTYKTYVAFSTIPQTYGKLILTPSALSAQMQQYFQIIPETLIPLIICLAGIVLLPYLAKSKVQQNVAKYILCICLTITALAGTVALLGWHGQLVYIWYPLMSLILPVMAYLFSTLVDVQSRTKFLAPAMLIIIAVVVAPSRRFDATMQLRIDELTSDLVQQLASMAKQTPTATTAGLLFKSMDSAEIGERIEGLTLSRLDQSYKGHEIDDSKSPMKFFNWASFHEPKRSKEWAYGEYKYFDSISRDSTYSELPGIDIYKYWILGGNSGWVQGRLTNGMLILMPFGNLPTQYNRYRGASLFNLPVEFQLKATPFKYDTIYQTIRMVRAPNREKYTLGWRILRVKSLLPITWQFEPDGWLLNGSKVCVPDTLFNHTLAVKSWQRFPDMLKVQQGNDTQLVHAQGDFPRTFAIPLRAQAHEKIGILTLSADKLPKIPGDPRPLMLHVDEVEVK